MSGHRNAAIRRLKKELARHRRGLRVWDRRMRGRHDRWLDYVGLALKRDFTPEQRSASPAREEKTR